MRHDKEIRDLYNLCGLDADAVFEVRRTINKGTLNNKLNTSCEFLTQRLYTALNQPRKRSMANVRVNAMTYLD